MEKTGEPELNRCLTCQRHEFPGNSRWRPNSLDVAIAALITRAWNKTAITICNEVTLGFSFPWNFHRHPCVTADWRSRLEITRTELGSRRDFSSFGYPPRHCLPKREIYSYLKWKSFRRSRRSTYRGRRNLVSQGLKR